MHDQSEENWERQEQDFVESSMTPASPEMDTPSSPTSPESSGSWKPVTKSIPLESETKYIPLERSKKLSTEEENRRSDFPKPISISSPKADRPKLSETESKNKLLKLKQKLEGKSGRELSPNLFISSNTKEVSESPQEPDSQRSEERSEAKQVTPRKSRPSWTSPTALDSPPSLSIAESPVSPDTQTASPEQMASPDTQTASPDGGLSPAPSQIPDTPASPDGHSSPEAALVIQDTPSSPDNSPSHENSFVFGKPLKEIPTVPITADSTRNEQDAQPIQVPVPSETKKKIDPRRRDPRNRNKEPPKIIPPKKSPYDPTYIPNVEVPSSSSASPNMENTTPAYMSNLVSNLPPPMWKHQQQQHRFENPLTMPHLRQSSSFQQMPPHQLQHRLPPPGMPFPMQGPRMPNRNQGPMMIDPHFQQPQQPKNYREYRKIKEEEDKKRKEFEEKKRNEEKSRKEAEIKNKQAISDPMVEDKDSSEDKEDEKHLNKKINDKIKESKDPRKKKLWNCEKSDKKETEKSDKKETEREDKKPTETIKSFKIPKMKKPDSEKKVEGNNDVKNIIKEVDIFKPLSKKESSDHKKRTKSEEKKDTTITASKSQRKMEKYITKSKENVKEKDSRKTDENSSGKRKSRAVKGKIDYSKMDISDSNDEDSDPIERDDIEETVEKRTPEPVENTSTENTLRDSISYPDSDSDSEPGLTIAEDTEEKKVSRSSESESENKKSSSPRKDLKKNKSKEKSESVAMDNKDTNLQNLLTLDDEIENSEPSFFKNKPSEEPSNTENKQTEEETFSKNDLTKELLKNIVSTLDPKEAKKMLEKASAMSKEENMSISKLKTLITADSDESEDEDMPIAKKRGRGRPKTPVKANPKKTKKKVVKKSPKISPTSKGTRRSRRLVQEDESEIEDRTIEEDQDTVMENETEEDKKTIEVSDEKISANDSIGLEDKTPTVEKFEEQKTESAEIMEPVNQEPTAGEPSKRQEDHVEEAQFETFVIEPKAVQKRGRKKRCKKPESYSELDEDLQDAFISSSNIIEQNQELKESKLEIKDESDPALKQSQATIDPKETTESDSNELREDLTIETVETVKPKLEVEDKADRRPSCEAQSPPPLGMRQTRSMRTRMAPKSKTWFPGDRGTAAKKSVFSGVVSPPIKQETVIKKENVEVDTKVFLGEGEVAGEIFKDNKFEFNEGKMEKEVITSLKTRHSTISSIFDKLVKKNQHQALSERASKADQVEIKQKSKEEPIKLCSKIKLSKPVVDLFGKPLDPPSLKPEIEMKPPDQIIASTTNLVQKLASQVKPNNLDNIELDHSDPPSLIDIIQGIKKRKERRKLPPPPLIPLNKNDEGPKSLDLVATELVHFTRKTCSSSSDLSKYKSSETLSEMFSPEILRNLFKCMGSMCAFSSDSPQSFSSHLHSHGLDSTNLLRCCYCFRKARSVEKLVTHIIKKHGSNKFQCIHCFYSSKSQMDLILHQNTFHKSFPKGFIACGHLASDSRNTTKIVATQTMKCPALNCHFESVSSDLKLIEEHLNFHTNVEEMIGYFCPYCEYSSDSHVKILLHQSIEHQGAVSRISIRQIEIRKPVLAENSSSDESEGESEAESDLSDFDKHFYDDDIESLDYLEKPETITEPENEVMAEAGLSEHNLYRCANQDCLFAAATSADFKDHLLSCDFASPTLPFTCFHCSKEHKHIPTLMEHMKTHSLKRMSCSLCDFKDSVMSSLKVHAKSMHKISNFKFVPVDSHKNNPEEDYFVLVPKNAIPKGPRSKYVKDTFSPTEIETIPIKPEIYKFLIRCSICDFASRVKNNLVKHLKLHLKEDKLIEIGALEESNLPTVTPVNPPPIEESETSAYSRMKSLLPEDLEEDLYRQPISEIDLAQMPVLIPENLRYACSGKDCRYITIDEVMLLYHIKALHGEMKRYKCPHCPNTNLAFDELPLHMKCHGELLFKCGYCTYYHWQKRIADKHVAEHHQGRKQFVKNVREDEESRKQVGREDSSKKTKKKDADPTKVSSYEPYKCGLCDLSSETVEAIRTHCREVHEMTKQFKCGMCNLMSDKKQEIEKHFSVKHSSVSFCMLKIFYVDPSTSNEYSTEEKSKPLWAREMEGIKHIRGILYDDFEIEKEQRKVPKLNISKKIRKAEKKEDLSVKPLSEPEKTEVVKIDPSPTLTKSKASKTELDYYPMKCKECDFPKKTVTGLKMHIKLNHLQLGKFQCQHCVFTANLKVSIQGHYRNKHTDTVLKEDGQDKFDYIERSSDAQAFTQEYWKEIWGVPTMDERKALLEQGNGALLDTSLDEESDMKRKRDDDAVKAKEPKKKRGTPGPKRGRKRKLNISVDDENPGTSHPTSDDFDANILKAEKALEALETAVPTIPVLMPIENSPFESHKTYMCVYCPRRSQNLERIQRHHGKHHSTHPFEFQELTRDQVVNLITSDQSHGTTDSDFKCFYCQHIGGITKLKEHNESAHVSQVFRVVKFQGKGITGYLECQICGYLSPGFEKYFQKAHFHEEHPLENDVNCSKYISKSKVGPDAFTSSQQAFKFDVNEVIGMTFECPKHVAPRESCTFKTQTLAQMNSHLRKHTKTYKCGHCGKTHLDNSEFHRHSALSHGDKIPDLVKDPEAEAEYEALKGLLEDDILKQLKDTKASETESEAQTGKKARLVARKSTNAAAQTKVGDKCRNVSRKSTGPGAKYWPETRIEIPYSFYKIPAETFDAKQIKTRMAMGGVEITLDAEKMGELIKLDPKLVVEDCKSEIPRTDSVESDENVM